MAGTDGDGQRVATCTLAEILHLFGLGVVRNLASHLVLYASQHTQLGLNSHVVGMGILNHLLGEGDVVLVGQRGTINHHAGETVVDAVLAQLEAVTMVEVQYNLRIGATQLLGIFHSTLGHVAQDGTVGIVAGTLGHLHDDGRLGFYGSLHDSLHLLQSVEVESGDGIAALHCLGEHLTGVHKTQFFVTCHNPLFKISSENSFRLQRYVKSVE